METVQVLGLREMGEALRKLPEIMELDVARRAVGNAAKVVQKSAVIKAPEYHGEVAHGHPPPGTLKKSIRTFRVPGLPKWIVRYIVFVKHGKKMQKVGTDQVNLDAFYWWFVEFGSVHNKGQHAFMRPAFEQEKYVAFEVMRHDFAYGLERAANEVKWGSPL